MKPPRSVRSVLSVLAVLGVLVVLSVLSAAAQYPRPTRRPVSAYEITKHLTTARFTPRSSPS